MVTGAKKKTATKKPKLSLEERRAKKLKDNHIRSIRAVFRGMSFERVPEVAEKQIKFLDQKGELDDCYIYENLILFVEYTTSNSEKTIGHLKHKKIIFDKISENAPAFIAYLRERFSAFDERLSHGYHEDRLRVKIVYCSRFDFDEAAKKVVDTPAYLDFPLLKYFENVVSAIKLSALPEFLDFLGIDPTEIGENGVVKKPGALDPYHGSILPEEASGFPKGYKVVSFYADADSLLKRAFVLRRNGWRGSKGAYQRLIIRAKVEAIRAALKSQGQVSINNVIATLPPDVMPIGKDGHTVKPTLLTKTEPVTITLPSRPNSIGLIDGQHRLFSYYRAKVDDPAIAKLRHEQNLLVTGIIYPPNVSALEAERFEASLFRSINSNQTNARRDLLQEIEVILDPFSPIAISKQVISRLSASGPLFGHVERYFYDKGKLKTSSIVSYGLVPLMKLSGKDSFFSLFPKEKQSLLLDGDGAALDEYIQFSTNLINIFLSSVRANIAAERWTTDIKQPRRLLTVTFVNAFLITIRMLIENKHAIEPASLKQALANFDKFQTKPFSSSQYNRMAEKIIERYF